MIKLFKVALVLTIVTVASLGSAQQAPPTDPNIKQFSKDQNQTVMLQLLRVQLKKAELEAAQAAFQAYVLQLRDELGAPSAKYEFGGDDRAGTYHFAPKKADAPKP